MIEEGPPELGATRAYGAHPVEVGPFRLIAPIGRGGMGEVWRGVHRTLGTGVAVKVLTSERARSARSIAAFRAEVRAVAALSHPAVVWVFDQGLINAEAARASGDRLPCGSPALAMELAEHTAEQLCGRLAWPALRALLEAVLAGLGHAHARGVIHRDLKPANVLIGGTRQGARISDFGLAWSKGLDDDASLGLSGTPAYMAPEQLEGDWRGTGPWTDLYAVGGLGWALATGSPPHGRVDLIGARAAARRGQLGLLEARHAVPAGFEDWLRRLLEPSPARRYERAADAAWALSELGEPDPDTTRRSMVWDLRLPTASPSGDAGQTESWLPSFSRDPSSSQVAGSTALDWSPEMEPPQAADTPQPRAAPVTHRPPPFTLRWREADPTGGATPSMLGAGLGLFGLRAVPLVGREAEREHLWAELARVREEGRTRLLLLRGGLGVGKTALVRWLMERAHELGAATPLLAVHSPVPGPTDGIGPMLARALRANGATRAELRRLLCARWPDLARERDQLAEAIELIAPESGEREDDLPRVRFSGQRERHFAFARLLARVAQGRPLILALDDVQWGLEALDFAMALVEGAGEAAPAALVLLTVRTEALAERLDEQERIGVLCERHGLQVLELGPLGPAEDRALVRQLLGFEHEQSLLIAERTAGNPLFAVQLVGDWVSRGIVEIGPQGFRLRPGADTSLPADLAALGTERLARALSGRPAEDSLALELAATLGQDVDEEEWLAACDEACIAPSADWINALAERGVLRADADRRAERFSFVHGMLRESVLDEAARQGRRARHHLTCASVLQARGAEHGRVGLHLLAAGKPVEASERLERGVDEAIRSRYIPTIVSLVRALEQALAAAGVAESDPRWCELWLRQCHVADVLGHSAEAAALASRIEAAAGRHGWRQGLAMALYRRAASARQHARPREALDLLTQARANQTGDRRLAEVTQILEIDCLLELHEVERARAALQALRELSGASHSSDLGLEVLRREFLLLDTSGAPPSQLLACAEDQLRAAREAGSRLFEARAHREVARALRLMGRLEEAAQHIERAIGLSEALGTAFLTQLSWMDLSEVQIEQGHYQRALVQLRTPTGHATRALVDVPRITAEVRIWLGVALAGLGRWEEADDELGRGLARYREDQTLEADVPRALGLASALAERAGEPERARRWLLEAALEHRRCGAVARAEEAERRAAGLR